MTKVLQPIELPYNLKHDELVISDPPLKLETYKCLQELKNRSLWGVPDDTIERILRGTVLLMNRPDNQDSLATCLEQAMIWEFG
jgi:hypothetical protein